MQNIHRCRGAQPDAGGQVQNQDSPGSSPHRDKGKCKACVDEDRREKKRRKKGKGKAKAVETVDSTTTTVDGVQGVCRPTPARCFTFDGQASLVAS